jgi:hypothetical protein
MIGYVTIPVPSGHYNSGEGAEDALDDSSIARMQKHGTLRAYYYYSGGYDGNGTAVIEKDGRYGTFGLAHCSCYQPVDECDQPTWFDSLDALAEKEPELVAAIRKALEQET